MSLNAALAKRDANAQITSNGTHIAQAQGEENKMQGAEQQQQQQQQQQHKAVSGLSGKGNGAYVSPSDAILSPASQKLAGFKQRQINKQNNNRNPTSRSLFFRTASTVSDASLETGSEDIKQ